MELDLQSLFGLINEGAIGQPRPTTSLCDPLGLGQGAAWHHGVTPSTSSAVCSQPQSNYFGFFPDSHCHLLYQTL